MGYTRENTKRVMIGNVPVGGGAPIVVQSMTKTFTIDTTKTIRQIKRLENLGCEVVRLAVPDQDSAVALGRIKKNTRIPLIADIHFDWRLALEAIRQGVDGLRINPGNIGARWKIKEVVTAAKERAIPIRVGVNSGSLERDILKRYKRPTPEALVESARRHIEMLEDMGFSSIKVSLKGSDVPLTIEAYRLFAEEFDYPTHIGITEAGPPPLGTIKSAVGLGILLYQGIGDTIRVSLTASPYEEVRAAYEILSSLGLRRRGVQIISCPTCGRCSIDIIRMARDVTKRLSRIDRPITVAVMGCVVNGPGEAREADYGIAGSKGEGILFSKGEVVKRVRQEELIEELMGLIREES